jgi:hypothetical protein
MDNRVELRNADGIPKSWTSPGCPCKRTDAFVGAIIVGLAAIVSIPAAAQVDVPLSFRVGGAQFTPGGFVDFGNTFRTAPNPFVAFKVNQAWGRWDCSTNAANARQACADPPSAAGYTDNPQLYWLDIHRGKWEFIQGQPWPVTGSFSMGVGGLVSNTQFSTPFSTLRTHANGAVLNFNGTLNTSFLWLNGSMSVMASPLLDAPGSFTESSGSFTDFGRLTSSSINGGRLDVGGKLFAPPPVNSPSVFNGGIVSLFGGYGFFNESLRGTVPGSMEFLVNSQTWQFARIGAQADLPLNLNLFNGFYNPTLTVSGAFNPWVQTQSSTFTGTGIGFQLESNLSFPLNTFLSNPNPALIGYNVDFFVKYTNMHASGDINGLTTRTPFDAKNENAIFGTNFKIVFGDIVVPPPAR